MARPHPEGLRTTRNQRVTPEKVQTARAFRRMGTSMEDAAWHLLRNRRLLGLKWRRQQVVLGFIVDFFCAEHGLVLEIDGGVHGDQRTADAERTRVLESAGLRVLRIDNDDVNADALKQLVSPLLHPGKAKPGE